MVSVMVMSHREVDGFVDSFAPSQETLLSIFPAKQLEGLRGSATILAKIVALGD